MRTWSVMLLAVALSLSASEGVAQMSRAALVKQSDIIFIGTVTQVGAVAVPEVPASARTVVVRVDQVLQKPIAVALTKGDSVTVETVRAGSLKPGTQATFYTTGWIFGRGVAVREVGHEPGRSPVVLEDQQEGVAKARREMHDADLKARIETAAMVVAGRVEQVRPAELATAPALPKRSVSTTPTGRKRSFRSKTASRGLRPGSEWWCGSRAHPTSPGSGRPGSRSDRRARFCSTRTRPAARRAPRGEGSR